MHALRLVVTHSSLCRLFLPAIVELHCTCRTPYDADQFYVGCDHCESWFHGKCVGITEEQVTYNAAPTHSPRAAKSTLSASPVLTCLVVCVLVPFQADGIDAYICSDCEQKTGKVTTYLDSVRGCRGPAQRGCEWM